MVPLSVLDLVPVIQGETPSQALPKSLDLARHTERLGYQRYWVAEHHNMIGIASAATSVVIGYLAGGTSRIRVGSGGIMLPNHAPIQIAEQFGTLESLYPKRIDLGLGRAPGTDMFTIQAMRRDPRASESFPDDVEELQFLLGDEMENQRVRAVPGVGTNVPLWILGSSDFGAQLAAKLGLPYAFASHFAPTDLLDALPLYRSGFQPSAQLAKPHAMACVNVIAAETDAEAKKLFTTIQMAFTDLRRGTRGLSRPPIDNIDDYWKPAEKYMATGMLQYSFVGSPGTVKKQVERFVAEAQVDELMVTTMVYDHDARKRSYEILKRLWD
jgi:luciferase family oxidoreductase group 1